MSSTQRLNVNGAGTYSQWDYPIFLAHYLSVDEPDPNDGDATFIADNGITIPNGVGEIDSFDVDDWTHGAKYIEKIEVSYWARLTVGTGAIACGLLFGGDNEFATVDTLSVGASYTKYTHEIQRPGGGNWNHADLSSIEVAVMSGAGGGSKLGDNIRVTQIYVTVTYTDEYDEIELDGHTVFPWPEKYYLTDEASDLGDGNGSGRFDRQLLTSMDSPADDYEMVTVDYGATKTCYGFTNAGVPNNADWETGTFFVSVFLWSYGSDKLELSVSVSRVNSAGVVQGTSSETAAQNCDSAVATVFAFEVDSKNWSAGATGDRIRVNYKLVHTMSGGGAGGVRVYFNNEGSKVGTHVVTQTGVTIDMDALTLASSSEIVVVAPGTVAVGMAASSLIISLPVSSVVPGVVSVTMDSLLSSAQLPGLTVVPGMISLMANSASLSAQPLTLTVSPGATSIALSAATLTATGQVLTLHAVTTLLLSAAQLTVMGSALTVVPGESTVILSAGSLTAAGQSLSVVPGPVNIPISAATIQVDGQTLGIVPGVVIVSLNSVSMMVADQMLSVVPVTVIDLSAASITATGGQLTVAPGPVTIPLSASVMVASGQVLSVMISGAPQTIQLAAASLTAVAQPLSVETVTRILLQAASLTATGNSVQIVPGAVVQELNPATFEASALDIALRMGLVILPDGRTFRVASEDRLCKIVVEIRALIVKDDERYLVVSTEDRTAVPAQEDRHPTVAAEERAATVSNEDRNATAPTEDRELRIAEEDRQTTVPSEDRQTAVDKEDRDATAEE